jgi:tetratricopeptide (TPR) repeat protein
MQKYVQELQSATSCRTITDIADTPRYEQYNKKLDNQGYQHRFSRIILEKCALRKKLLGSEINVHPELVPECDVQVCFDKEEISFISLDCIRPVDSGSAVVLAKSLFDGGFKATSIKYVQSLRAVTRTNHVVLLQISDWLIEIGEYQEAEAVLHKVLRLDPSVTSSNHLKAMRNLAELKTLLGLHDDAICLLEAVLQNDPDPQSEHTASALLRLSRAYTKVGEFA